MNRMGLLIAAIPLALLASCAGEDTSMSFFLTSEGPGNGAALGGLAGADRYGRFCQKARRFALLSIRMKMFLDLTSGGF